VIETGTSGGLTFSSFEVGGRSVEVVAGSFRSYEIGGLVTSGVDKVSDGTNAVGSAVMCDG